jgi:hypothetical protein
MRQSPRLFLFVLIVVLAVSPVMAGAGNANFFLGQRQIDTGEDDTDDIEDQPAFGVSVDFQTGSLPFSWFAGLYASAKEEDIDLGGGIDASVTVELAEISFGLGKVWQLDKTRPFVHGGVSLTRLDFEVDIDPPFSGRGFDDDDQARALYGEGGVYWRLGDAFNIGLAGRILLGTEYEFEGESLQADYVQGGLILGWGWD